MNLSEQGSGASWGLGVDSLVVGETRKRGLQLQVAGSAWPRAKTRKDHGVDGELGLGTG